WLLEITRWTRAAASAAADVAAAEAVVEAQQQTAFEDYGPQSHLSSSNYAPPQPQPPPQYLQQPPLPSMPPPSEHARSEFVPPLPAQPAPPLPLSPVLQAYSSAAPQYAPAPPQPLYPPPPPPHQSTYSDALYQRQQAYAPLSTQPPPSSQPQPQYHQPPQPQYQVQVVHLQPPAPPPPYQPQPPQYHQHQPQQPQHQSQQPQHQLQPPQYHQDHQPQQLPQSTPWEQPATRHQPRPPPSTYCCHKCGEPGHWIQDCQAASSNRERGGDRSQRPASYAHPPRQLSLSSSQLQHHQAAPPLPDCDAPQRPHHPPQPVDADDATPDSHATHEPDANDAALSLLPPSQWVCKGCDKTFALESQFLAHERTHVQCHAPGCGFAASKRVVGAHFQTAHGQFAGQGLKEVEVEGQKFLVLVGNSPEDIAKWRAERRKRWPSATKRAPIEATAQASVTTASDTMETGRSKRKLSAASEELEDGEVDEDDGDSATRREEQRDTGDSEGTTATATTTASPTTTVTATTTATATTAVTTTDDTVVGATCDGVEPPVGAEPSPKRQKRVVLCKNFARSQCRFGDACRFSHSRRDVVCRSMVQKGRCARGDACQYGHDAQLVADATARKSAGRAATGDRALEQAWRAEQGSLLRKLLAKDVGVEQQRMLQIVRCLVRSNFCQDDLAPETPVVEIVAAESRGEQEGGS
ncbi:hypothetical protein PybrP1_005484, partial [[Pythium] brassicae (nom. inval.)]